VAGYTKMVYPETVAHPSIIKARRRVTTLTYSKYFIMQGIAWLPRNWGWRWNFSARGHWSLW